MSSLSRSASLTLPHVLQSSPPVAAAVPSTSTNSSQSGDSLTKGQDVSAPKVGIFSHITTTLYKLQIEPFVELSKNGIKGNVLNIIRAVAISLTMIALVALPISYLFLAGSPIELAILIGAVFVFGALNCAMWYTQKQAPTEQAPKEQAVANS